MNTVPLNELAGKQVVLLDGGMGTMLMERGLKQGQVPELLNAEQPEIVRSVHCEYVAAGADALLTNTFGASPLKLGESRLSERTAELNRLAVEIARASASPGTFIIGDIGPCGKILEPYGDLSESALTASFEQQIGSLLSAQVDALIFETQMDLREAAIGIAIARKMTSLPIIASFTFNKSKRGFFTLMGNSVRQAINGALEAGADIVGTNCTLDSAEMQDLVKEIKTFTSLPVYAKPNAGKAGLVDGRVSYSQSVDDFAASITQLLEAGIGLIGGCCGTNPSYIKALKQMLAAPHL